MCGPDEFATITLGRLGAAADTRKVVPKLPINVSAVLGCGQGHVTILVPPVQGRTGNSTPVTAAVIILSGCATLVGAAEYLDMHSSKP